MREGRMGTENVEDEQNNYTVNPIIFIFIHLFVMNYGRLMIKNENEKLRIQKEDREKIDR